MSLYRTSAGEMEWDTTQPLQITLVLQRDGLVWHIPAVLELERLDAEPVKPRELRTDLPLQQALDQLAEGRIQVTLTGRLSGPIESQ